MKISTIKLDWSPGCIYNKLNEAVEFAKAHSCSVEFPFNGVNVVVNNRSSPEDFDLVLDAVKRKSDVVLV
jgi:hypothetical protein